MLLDSETGQKELSGWGMQAGLSIQQLLTKIGSYTFDLA
jgi:hypothetical protein